MSFRIRIMLLTVALIALFTSIGGMVMIHTTFQRSLEKEEQAAVDSTRLVLKMLQVMEEKEEWFEEKDMISAIETISGQGAVDAVLLVQDETVIYQMGTRTGSFETEQPDTAEDKILVSYLSSENHTPYIQTSVRIILGEADYSLHMGRNFSHVYEVRESQIRVFQQTFVVLLILGSIAAWGMASYLTEPIRKLRNASREIASGNLSYRSNIQGKDELASLSEDFDRMAEKLEENIAMLKESALQKERFMGAFTHELKTPMTSIIGYADLLRSQRLTKDESQDALYYIFTEAKRLENMSLKMLDLFVADKTDPDYKDCDPLELARFVARHLAPAFEKKGIEILVEGKNSRCFLDTDLVQALFINLFDNARKAMEQGGRILVTVDGTEDGCQFSVKDDGKGIPKEALAHLTEAFYRVDKARAREEGSAGIGLALCDKIVKLHQGTMIFESEPGKGTTVTVRLKGGNDEKNRI